VVPSLFSSSSITVQQWFYHGSVQLHHVSAEFHYGQQMASKSRFNGQHVSMASDGVPLQHPRAASYALVADHNASKQQRKRLPNRIITTPAENGEDEKTNKG
jgi:hypothetical protein